jgi:hypothetical protein
MKIDSTVSSKDLALEPIDSASLERARGGLDSANTAFVVGSLLGIAGYMAEHHVVTKLLRAV